jgi:DNA-directed RNA polymerase specialized sigma24 family protein
LVDVGTTRTLPNSGLPLDPGLSICDELRRLWTHASRAVPNEEVAPRKVESQVDWEREIARGGPRVHVALVAAGCRIDLAREIAHEAWLKIIAQHQARELADLKLPQLVIAQALFYFRDHCRREQRRKACTASYSTGDDVSMTRILGCASAQGEVHEASATGPNEPQLDARAQLREVNDFLARCTPLVRAIFVGTFGPNPRSAETLAAELGITPARLRKLIYETRMALRKLRKEVR